MIRKTNIRKLKVEYEQDMNDYMEEGKELVRRAEEVKYRSSLFWETKTLSNVMWRIP